MIPQGLGGPTTTPPAAVSEREALSYVHQFLSQSATLAAPQQISCSGAMLQSDAARSFLNGTQATAVLWVVTAQGKINTASPRPIPTGEVSVVFLLSSQHPLELYTVYTFSGKPPAPFS